MSHSTSSRLKAVLRALTLFAAGGMLFVPATRGAGQVALGPQGEIYEALVGRYGELFPEGEETHPSHVVMALEITHADGTTARRLVPGTEGDDVESSPALVLEHTSRTLYAVWEGTINYIHSGIHLVSLKNSAWSEVIEISGDVFSWKTGPHLAVTRGTYSVSGSDGEMTTRERTFLHTVWWEEAGAGERVIYAPIVLIDGVYIGWNPVYTLSDFDRQPMTPDFSIPIADALHRSPTIRPGSDGSTVVAALARRDAGELVTFQIRTLPVELSNLAGEARAHIIEIGASLNYNEVIRLAEETRARIVQIGGRFHGGILEYLAGEARAHIIEIGARLEYRDAIRLANKVRDHLIESGSGVLSKAVRSLDEEARSHFIEIDSGDGSQHFEVVPVSRHPAPETGDGVTTLFLSPDGKNCLVAWEEEGLIRYRESEDGAWSPVYELDVTLGLGSEEVYRILKRRMGNR